MARLTIRNPVAQVAVRKSALAPRLSTLNNQRIALYWNGKAGGNVALTRVGQLLNSRFPGLGFELIRSGMPGPRELLEHAKTFQAVIGSTGD